MYKQKSNPFPVTPCGRRRNYMTSPLNKKDRLKMDKANRERYNKMPQRVKDSLQQVAYEYGGPFFSPKHQVNVDPEDGVLYNRPIYADGTMLTYPSLSKPVKRETELNKPPSPVNKAEPRRTIGKGKNFNKVSKDKSATGGAAGGGMTQKGVNEYKRKNPGSKLETAVTKKPSELKPGSKDAKRRKSFCARSKSWKSERGKAARRRWNC